MTWISSKPHPSEKGYWKVLKGGGVVISFHALSVERFSPHVYETVFVPKNLKRDKFKSLLTSSFCNIHASSIILGIIAFSSINPLSPLYCCQSNPIMSANVQKLWWIKDNLFV